MEHLTVRGLPLSGRLTSLLAQGRWRQPDPVTLAKVIPWFEDPLNFLTSTAAMEQQSRSMDMFADDPYCAFFRETRGSISSTPVELPWLDVEQAVLIAVNLMPGDDVALALDYRTDPLDPRVVGSDFWTNPSLCEWRTVAPAFSVFAADLGF
ncbi:hypothetical protein [Streptacidiphilus sp. EB103A]|uniref:hypothetical protein n=1 Tax=Streptacidiphilus sp. EB103A TaxID=3156275 RepID=UPI00351410C4